TGKSVLIKCIQGLLTPDSGSIEIDGIEIINENPEVLDSMHSKMGMLFQGGALFDSLTVWENVAFDLIQNRGMRRKEAKIVAIKVLRQVGLGADIADLYPSELSGGMQKRVGLARAVITRPEIIFFDEPTTGLDPIMADVINDLIIESAKDLGATTLTITHDMTSARKIADKIAMLYQGKIIWYGTVKELDKTDNPYVRQFINGSSKGPIKVEK
ncbi:MAG: ATP-binding cassette domain-containing protein, partial [Alphaproteobacteria bacterium]|nr:ATP-binding cassette domain-containing protein [Alphaproteobacteria bacterium]